ncbi:hypothetical protein CDL60_27130 [Roseateles noduli]|nr:hypothetical protein CDL60_27130 [Roseateles noduli]
MNPHPVGPDAVELALDTFPPPDQFPWPHIRLAGEFAAGVSPPHLGALKLLCDRMKPGLVPSPRETKVLCFATSWAMSHLRTLLPTDPSQSLIDQLELGVRELQEGCLTHDLDRVMRGHDTFKSVFDDVKDSSACLVVAPPRGLAELMVPTISRPARLINRLLTGCEAGVLWTLDTFNRCAFDIGDGEPAAMARMISMIIQATIIETPFDIDIDGLRALDASTTASAAAMLKALRACHPVLVELGRQGLLPAPQVLVREPATGDTGDTGDAGALATWREFTGSEELGRLLPGPRPRSPDATAPATRVDDTAPLQCVLDLGGVVEQRLDRASGRITVEWPCSQAGGRYTTSFQFEAPPDSLAGAAGAAPERRTRQDLQIRQLDDFARAHLVRAATHRAWTQFPPTVRHDGDRILVGRQVLARQSAGLWTTDLDAVRHALNITGWWSAVPHAWPAPATDPPGLPLEDGHPFEEDLSLDAGLPGAPVRELRLVLQMEQDSVIAESCATLHRRHADRSVWIHIDDGGRPTVVVGAALLIRVPSDVALTMAIVGHGGRAAEGTGDRMLLSDYTPDALAQCVSRCLGALGLPMNVSRITLDSCMLETPTFDRGYAADFLRCVDDLGLTAVDATVTAYAHTVQTWSRYRTTRPYVGAAPLRGAPGSSLQFRIDPDEGRIIRHDRCPAGPPPRVRGTHRPRAGATILPASWPPDDVSPQPAQRRDDEGAVLTPFESWSNAGFRVPFFL